MNTITYPRLIKRVRATLIDSVLLPVTVFSSLLLGDALGVSSTGGKTALLVAPIVILEPGLVAFTGGTIGHHIQRIRIATLDGSQNIGIFAATLRFIVKVALGWLSFVIVLTTVKHQAVHDLLARSVVIHKDVTGLPTYEVLHERDVESPNYVYPPAWRRIVTIVAYAIVATIGLGIVSAAVSTGACLAGHTCTTIDKLLEMALSISWLVGIGWIVVRGWSGRLLGCRRRSRDTTT